MRDWRFWPRWRFCDFGRWGKRWSFRPRQAFSQCLWVCWCIRFCSFAITLSIGLAGWNLTLRCTACCACNLGSQNTSFKWEIQNSLYKIVIKDCACRSDYGYIWYLSSWDVGGQPWHESPAPGSACPSYYAESPSLPAHIERLCW